MTISTAYAIRGHDMIYDANGNLIQGDGFYYEYNDANQLKRVREDNSSGTIIAEYWYDTDGRRVKKVEYTDEGNKTTYYWDKDYETVVYPDGTEVEYLYIYANNEKIAKKVFNGSETDVTYYHTDHLGSSSVITDENGSLVERTKYYPYGAMREGGEANKYYYTGKELDKETGLYYYGARYYHPIFATFTQADIQIPNQYAPQSLNRYSYTLNNPMKYTDPSGHNPVLFGLGLVELGVLAVGALYTLATMDQGNNEPLQAPGATEGTGEQTTPGATLDSGATTETPGASSGNGLPAQTPGQGGPGLPISDSLFDSPLNCPVEAGVTSDIKIGRDKAIITYGGLLDKGMGDLHDTIPGKEDRYGNLYSNQKVHTTWRLPGGKEKVIGQSEGILDYQIESEASESEDNKET